MKEEISIGVLKGAIGAIPYAGTLLNEIIFDTRSRIKQARIEKFLVKYSESLNKLDALKSLEQVSKDESFSDFLEFVLNLISKNRFEEKTQIYRDILVSATIENDFDHNMYEKYTEIFSRLSYSDIKIAVGYYGILFESPFVKNLSDLNNRAQGFPLELHNFFHFKTDLFGVPFEKALLSIDSLIQRGIWIDTSSSYTDTSPREMIVFSRLGLGLFSFVETEIKKGISVVNDQKEI